MQKIEIDREIIKNGVKFGLVRVEGHDYPTFDGKWLGSLKWGHPALLAWFDDPGGSRMESPASWDRWWAQECKKIEAECKKIAASSF